ncbi:MULTISPECIES: ABC transporter permease subunit [Streptomyces]|uniref:ABC transporter permease n=1 Tax=Streptomyces amritsarensis TaxID=681158 RepID=A0ABX3GAH8_9ACTN|nr:MULTISPECIES: ABC transporter permease subunit [Streptomyces]AQT74460.1 ABC transporter permease [Streptomyces sp. fd1-xmd]MDX6759343.1 ABC transporter permease subunit [Streptomyces sp. F8]OLZ74003.1 ABC transporter permease [Streptomyces amritsarensis]
MAFSAVLTSEWTKIRTVASTSWTLATALLVTVAMGAGLCAVVNATFDTMPESQQIAFDPTQMSFSGMLFGQVAVLIFGAMVVGSEYSTGMIRSSLAAVPARGALLLGKLTVATALALVVGLATGFLSFFLGQALLGEHSTTLGEENVLRAVIGVGLYMALLAVFAMGVSMMLRNTAAAISILISFVLILPIVLSLVDATRKIAFYLPNQAGSAIMQTVSSPAVTSDAPYGPWGGLGIMVLWVAAAVLGGYLVLSRRDA